LHSPWAAAASAAILIKPARAAAASVAILIKPARAAAASVAAA
jgi:hypothetical protein